jgi:hypothetical protein
MYVRFNVCRVLNKVCLKNYCFYFLLLCLPGLTSTLKMEAVQSSEKLVGLNCYQTTMRRIPEAGTPDSRFRDKHEFPRTLGPIWVLVLYVALGIVS